MRNPIFPDLSPVTFLDFLIGKALLEFEEDDFALVVGQAHENVHDLSEAFLVVGLFVGLESGAGDFFPADFVEWLDAFVFAQEV